MSPSQPRVRFAPSPTGYLHLGNVRTALFDWLYARQAGGTCLLRIEDTDESRNHPEWVDLIYKSLEWLGLGWDGEPTFQSKRFAAHRETAVRLADDGKAYYCDCTKEDVDRRLAERAAAGGDKTPGYDSFCRDRGLGAGDGRALRFRVPKDEVLVRHDVVYGTTEIDAASVEDFVILRSTGVPLYVFANALDDVDDEITHVVRGSDHLNNVPKQMLLRRALGLDDPVWVHVPLINAPNGKKLSKRRDKVALDSFRAEGYLPEAMLNYLATLGWMPPSDSPDEPEIASLTSMVASFRLEDVSVSNARFDEQKLAAFNGIYLRRMPLDEFKVAAKEFYGGEKLDCIAEHVQSRVQRLDELGPMLGFLDALVVDDAAWEKAIAGIDAGVILGRVVDCYESAEWEAAHLHGAAQRVADEASTSLRKAQAPIRVSVTGSLVGPPLFESLVCLGREETLARLRGALARLG